MKGRAQNVPLIPCFKRTVTRHRSFPLLRLFQLFCLSLSQDNFYSSSKSWILLISSFVPFVMLKSAERSQNHYHQCFRRRAAARAHPLWPGRPLRVERDGRPLGKYVLHCWTRFLMMWISMHFAMKITSASDQIMLRAMLNVELATVSTLKRYQVPGAKREQPLKWAGFHFKRLSPTSLQIHFLNRPGWICSFF